MSTPLPLHYLLGCLQIMILLWKGKLLIHNNSFIWKKMTNRSVVFMRRQRQQSTQSTETSINLASLKNKDCIWAGDCRSSTFFLSQLLLARLRLLENRINIPQNERCSWYWNEAKITFFFLHPGKVANSCHSAIQSLSGFSIMINFSFKKRKCQYSCYTS